MIRIHLASGEKVYAQCSFKEIVDMMNEDSNFIIILRDSDNIFSNKQIACIIDKDAIDMIDDL